MSPADAHPAARAARRRAALAGVLAAALTLATAHLAAAVVSPSSDPLVAVGGAFVDATPRWLKNAAIALFGVNDKTALLVGMVVVLAALAAGAGVLALRSRRLGTVAVLLLGTVGAVAAASRPDAGVLGVVPSLLGAVVGAIGLRPLVDRADVPRARPPRVVLDPAALPERDGARPARQATQRDRAMPDRRSFLRAAVVVSVAAAVVTAAGSVVTMAGRAATTARELLRLPSPRVAAAPVPAGAQSSTAGVVDVVTANEDFYRIDTALSVPRIDPSTWTLRVHGLVEEEVVLTFDELLGGELVEAYVTLACVSNAVGGDLIGNARWLGLPIRDVLARARPRADADMVLSRSIDGFTASSPIGALTDDRDALLAVGMNGEPLPLAHGFPVRMVVPGLYGYVSATKWVTELEVTRFADQDAYWTVRGWSSQGPIKTSSRIEVPAGGSSVDAGTVAVGGTAWAQHTGITGVEVQVDDGAWETVTLSDEISVDTWRQWSWRWEATPGTHRLRVRATDASGETQTSDVAGVLPDGATGWHEVVVTVRGA